MNPLSLGEKQEVLRYLVLDPSRISDSLFLDLTGISESDWTIKTQAEQMEMKRSYIPYFKQLFTDSFQLLTHVGAGTGRIARLPFHPLMPHIAGQYLVFQELQSLDIRRIHARESRKNNISVKLLPDIWSLARSQEYAGEAMSRKISLIQDCKSELMGIRVRYPDANEIERRETIAEFIKKFSQKQAYAFKKIITVRKPKLRYTNVGIDSAVLMGMSNDLDRYYYEIVSKWTQIQRQALLIRNMADVHAVQFHRFLDALHTEFSQFDSSDMERRILDTVESEKEFGFVGSESFKIGKIWHHAKLYRDILSLPVSTGAPFFEIENRVIHAISKVRMSSPKTNVRELLKLVVYSKLAAYEIALRQIRDGLRTEKIALMRDVYLDRLQRTIDILGSLHFLKGIKFDKFDIEFEKKLASLQTIFGLLQSGKFDLAHDLVKTLVGR